MEFRSYLVLTVAGGFKESLCGGLGFNGIGNGSAGPAATTAAPSSAPALGLAALFFALGGC
jgi:hypothetical protein